MTTSPEILSNRMRVLNTILSSPERHNQSTFGRRDEKCGTVMCIAGWAAYYDPNVSIGFDRLTGLMTATRDGDPIEIDAAGKDYLGLDHSTAAELFYDFNDQSATRKLAILAADGEIL